MDYSSCHTVQDLPGGLGCGKEFCLVLFHTCPSSKFLSCLRPQDELVAVLKANHLTSAKAVAKKAQTIMRQADADGSGTLTLEEFLVVAKKFPNLVSQHKHKAACPTIIPQHKVGGVLGGGGVIRVERMAVCRYRASRERARRA